MGAGKTTVGRMLAKRLAWRFIDADTEIETATGSTIAQLFLEHGEPWFRQLEHETIRQLLTAPSIVLALGGGAIEDDRTRSLLLCSEGTQLVHPISPWWSILSPQALSSSPFWKIFVFDTFPQCESIQVVRLL